MPMFRSAAMLLAEYGLCDVRVFGKTISRAICEPFDMLLTIRLEPLLYTLDFRLEGRGLFLDAGPLLHDICS